MDNPDNWTVGCLDSLNHKTKKYTISLILNTISIITPTLYSFEDKTLNIELCDKYKLVLDALQTVDQDKIRNKLIEEFGLEDRATKLKALEEISKTMPDSPEEFKLPKKKNKFWKNWFIK